MPKAMLIDISKCTACRGCMVACKQWNRLPAEQTVFSGTYENPKDLTADTWCRLKFIERGEGDNMQWMFAKTQCMHCADAACVMVCPTGATHKTDLGTVAVDPKKCIGCNYCVANCPFHVPRYDQRVNAMRKCTFCVDRLAAGRIPACAQTCPTGAIKFGEMPRLVTEAQARLKKLKASGHPNARLYGVEEMGGMRMMYLLPDHPSVFGLPDNPAVPTTAFVWSTFYRPFRAIVVAAAAIGLISNRMRSKELEPVDKEG